ncbi:MAG: hypothetical protein ISS72_06770 [Candidatus Brocadiae bacterium]|nr:hypothetical protein [Candidatus Brocadiia bacterium]
MCDRCGAALLVGESVRYEARIEVYAAYDPAEIVPADLEGDLRGQMRELIATLRGVDPQELEDSVYKAFRFDLCMACQREYLRDPLSRVARPEGAGPD